MRIGLLHFTLGGKITSRLLPKDIKMLRDEVKNLGYIPKIIREDKCQIYFPRRNPKILYAGKPLPKMDVVIPRVSVLSNVALRTTILQQLEMLDVPLLQRYKSVIRSKNKLRTLQLLTNKNIPVPRTIVVQRFEYLDTAIKKVGGFPIIIKTPFGSMGKGVAIVESKRSLHSAFDMLLTSREFSSLLIQEYVEEAEGKDLRVFVLDGKVLASMERTANADDFRSNLVLGGVGKSVKLTKDEIEIALYASKVLKLHFAGVDLLRSKYGPVVMEVNCNPGLEGITETTGVNVAQEIVKYAASFAQSKN